MMAKERPQSYNFEESISIFIKNSSIIEIMIGF